MSLCPRYSLLTLLVLTALVAGGVKLWYGPHHVVERTSPDVEEEYTFTRDWCGDKILHGPSIMRTYDDKRLVSRVMIGNYRDGKEQQILYMIYAEPSLLEPADNLPQFLTNSPLNEAESVAFNQAVERESQQIRDQGNVVDRGYLWPYLIPNTEKKN